MSKTNKMSLKKIFDTTDLIMRVNDIIHFCEDIDTIKKFVELDKKEEFDSLKMKDFLLEHEDKINKEKLVLAIVKNYYDNIKTIKNILEDKELLLKNLTLTNDKMVENLKADLLELEIQMHRQEENLRKAKKLGRGIDQSFTMYFFNKKENQYDIRVVDSKEMIDGVYTKNTKNLKRFKEIDEKFKEEDKEKTVGIEYMLQSIVLTDFCEIFPDVQFGDSMRTLVLENAILKENIKTREELEEIKNRDYEEYEYLLENTEFSKMLPDIKNLLEKYIKYVDIDRLITICAYRFEEGLENGVIDHKNADTVKLILNIIINNFKDDKKVFKYSLQSKKNNSYEMEDIYYSVKDIKQCINRFTSDGYITKTEIEENKEKIYLGEINLPELDSECVDIIFSVDELEEISKLSDQNLQYVATKLDWKKDKIIDIIENKKNCSTQMLKDFITQQKISSNDIVQLYIKEIIDLNQIKELKNNVDLSKSVNSYELIQYYRYSIEKESKEENNQGYIRYLELYKEILIEDKPEEIENCATELMEQMVENYDKSHVREHIEQLEEYYKHGLLTLNVIIEWNDEEVVKKFITDLYREKIIPLEDIKLFIKNRKISFGYIEQLVWTQDISYEERMKVLEEGWVPEEEIFKLFSKTLIREEDLLKLSRKSIISKKRAEDIINKTQLKDLEQYSNIVLEVDDRLQKIKRDESLYSNEKEKGYNTTEDRKPKLMIDPNEREELFNLLGAGKPDRVKIAETSPFYNYEFYVIPDESGKINRNSVVIAERIYEEKEENLKKQEEKNEKKIRFATDNATYFFKYKDLMVLSNYLKKDEVVKEKKNIVFKANHTIATDEKNGHWAASVIYGIVKTMLSSDLKEYSKENQRKIVIEKLSQIYSFDEIMKILDKGTEIDSGDYICEIIDEDNETLSNEKMTDNTAR